MKNVLLVNRGYCNNLGDQAIKRAMESFLTENFDCSVSFSDYTSNADASMDINIERAQDNRRSALKKILKLILPMNLIWFFLNFRRINRLLNKDFDLVILGGGQLILSNNGFGIAAATWVFLAGLYKKKLVFCCVGSGSNFTTLNKFLFKYALNNCSAVSVRDNESAKVLKEKFGVISHVIGDVVFTETLSMNTHREGVAFGLPSLSLYNTYNKKLSRGQYYEIWIEYISSQNLNIQKSTLFFTTQEDFCEVRLFRNYYYETRGVKLSIAKACTLEGLVCFLGQFEVVVSGRMHALILALNSGCRPVVYPISNKLKSFANIVTSEKFSISAYKYGVSNLLLDFLEEVVDLPYE